MDAAFIASFDARYGVKNGIGALCADGDSVKTWNDQSPAAMQFLQASIPAQPIFKTNIFGTNPGVLFDGLASSLPSVGQLSVAQELTVFVVHKPDAAIAIGKTLLDNVAAGSFRIFNSGSANTWGGQLFATGGGFIAGTNGTPMVTSFIRSGVIQTIGENGARLRGLDGATSATGFSNLTLGSNNGGAANFYKGYVTRILVFNRALTEKEAFSVELGLAGLYGITFPRVIPLDRNVLIEAGKTYSIDIWDQSSSLVPVNAVLNAMVGSWNAFTTSTAISAPIYAAAFIIKPNDLAPELWRVIAVEESDRQTYRMTALGYNASKFAAVDTGSLLDVPITSSIATPYFVRPPTSPAVVITYVQLSQNLVQETLELSWTASPDPLVLSYEVGVRKDLANWIRYNIDTGATTVSITILGFGSYELEIRAVNRNGSRSAAASISYSYSETTIASPSFSPPAPLSFTPGPQAVTITGAAGTTIRYTIDGTDPTSTSALYSAAISCAVTTTIKARAFIGVYYSVVITGVYTLGTATGATCAIPVYSRTNRQSQPGYFTLTAVTAGSSLKYRKNGGAWTDVTTPPVTFTIVALSTTDVIDWYGYKAGLLDSIMDTYDNTVP